jgi:seryl-tRNA synthetase
MPQNFYVPLLRVITFAGQMLHLQVFREQPERVIEGLKKHVSEADKLVKEVLQLDEQRRATQKIMDSQKAEANQLAAQIGEKMKQGLKDKAQGLRDRSTALKESVKAFEEKLAELEKAQRELLVTLPNLPHASVPQGKTPEENEVVLEWGNRPALAEGALASLGAYRQI